jgi:hypothetical protein
MLKSKLLTYDELKEYLFENYEFKGNIHKFIKKNDSIKLISIPTKNKHIPGKLYHDTKLNTGSIDAYDIALSLRKNSYLTGYKLISLLGWTEYIPRIIHVNWIRGYTKNIKSNEIDNDTVQKIAYKHKHISSLRIKYEDYEIVLLSGQLFLEIYEHHFMIPENIPQIPEYSKIFIPERLIIECLINYHYFGGADLVWNIGLEQFQKLDPSKLTKIYADMSLIYPYSNSIGYWLEKAGIDNKILDIWETKVNRRIKFHLFMGDKERRIFNKKWNLYIPKRFS